jgi:chorismate mutase
MIRDRISRRLRALKEPAEVPDEPVQSDLLPWRHRIDEIDQMTLELLNERARCANVIGRLKKKVGLPVYVPQREEKVLEQVRKANEGPLPDTAVRNLFERIIDETRSLERKKYQDD